MNKNVTKLLATAMVVGFVAGSSVVVADHHKGHKKDAKHEKNSCKAGAKKGAKDGCKSADGKKDGCKGAEHPAEGHPADAAAPAAE